MDLKEAQRRIRELEEQLELQRLLADNAFEAIGVFNEELRCVAANNEVTEVLGYEHDEVLGLPILDFIAPQHHALAANIVNRAMIEPYFVNGIRKDGTIFPAEARGKTVVLHGKKYRVASLRDISFREDVNSDLKAALREMNIIFANTKVGLMFLMGGRKVRRVNQTMADILGYTSPDEMKGLDIRELHLSEKNYQEFGDAHFTPLAQGAQLNIEYRLRKKDGTPVWCSLSGQAVDAGPSTDLSKGVLWVVDDISVRKEKEARLLRLATTDDLTGALTRSEFFRLANRALENEKRTMSGSSAMMIDIDHFKRINDSYGHDAGDEVLHFFAKKCHQTLRENDLFVRLGGEEFAILLPTTDIGGAIVVAERLRKEIEQCEVRTANNTIKFTTSIGVAGTGSKTVEVEKLIRRADKALYEAKREGRNRVVFHD